MKTEITVSEDLKISACGQSELKRQNLCNEIRTQRANNIIRKPLRYEKFIAEGFIILRMMT